MAGRSRPGHHRWLEAALPLPRFPAALSAADHLALLRDFARQTGEAREPAELLWRLCTLCTETLGLQAAEAHLVEEVDGRPRIERLGAAGHLALEGDGAMPARVVEVLAGHRRCAVVRNGSRAHPSRENGAGHSPRSASVAVVPLRAGDRVLALLVVAGRLSAFEWHTEGGPALEPYLQQAAGALHHLLAYRQIERRAERLSAALCQVSDSLVTHTELEPLLDTVCHTLVSVTPFETAAVFLHDLRAGQLQARAAAGPMGCEECFWQPFGFSERLPGFAAAGRIVTVELGIQRDDRPEATRERRLGIETLVSAPLLLREELLGVLSLGALTPHAVTREDMDIARAVANQLASAVANSRLLAETRMRREEQARASKELSLLYSASRAVVGNLSLDERLREVADGLVQATQTSHCAIFRMERDGLFPWLRVGGTSEESRRFLTLVLSPLDVARLLRVLKSRKAPVVAHDTPRDPFAASPWKQEFGIRTALWLPLVFQNRITGVALVWRPHESQAFTPEQLQLARAVSHQAAIIIRLSQAYEHERSIAVTLQKGLGPTVAARLQNFDIGHTYHPALQEPQVGGDIYDAFFVPDGRVALLMADVSGKGIQAALQTTMLKNMLRALSFEDPSPPSVFARLNKALHFFADPELFVTAFYGVLCPATGALTYSNAGHDCPLFYSAQEEFCAALDTTGIALGMDANSAYASREIRLAPGDVLLLYTDGVTEARSDTQFFGRGRLEDLLAQVARSKPSRIVSTIYQSVRTHSQGELHDDIALLVIKAKSSWKNLARS